MVEVDREEEPALVGFTQQRIRLVEVEDQRLLHEQRDSAAKQVQGRFEVPLVRQADGDQVRALGVEHLVDVRVGGTAERGSARCGPGLVPAHDRAELRVRSSREDARVLEPPTRRAPTTATRRMRPSTSFRTVLVPSSKADPTRDAARRPRSKGRRNSQRRSAGTSSITTRRATAPGAALRSALTLARAGRTWASAARLSYGYEEGPTPRTRRCPWRDSNPQPFP